MSTPQTIAKRIERMSLEELLELRGLVDGYIAAAEVSAPEVAAEEPATEGGTGKAQKGRRGGYIELKTINGCGPYAYRRTRVGGRLTSEYIGKVKQ